MPLNTQADALFQIQNLLSSAVNSYVRSDTATTSAALVNWNPSPTWFGVGPLQVTVSASTAVAVVSILAPLGALNSYPLWVFADTSSLLFLVTLDPSSIGPNAIYGVDPTTTSLTGINCAAGSPTVTMTDTTGLQPGWYLNCAGVDPGTAIFSVDSGTQVTLVANATANEAGITGTAQAGVNLDPGFGYELVYDWLNSYWRLLYQSVPAGSFSLVGINPSAGPFAGSELDVNTSTGLYPSNTSGGNPTLQMLDASDTQVGVVNTGTQTFAGDKTLIGSLALQVPLSGLSTALLDGTGLTVGDLTLAAQYANLADNLLSWSNIPGGIPTSGTYDVSLDPDNAALTFNSVLSDTIPNVVLAVVGYWNGSTWLPTSAGGALSVGSCWYTQADWPSVGTNFAAITLGTDSAAGDIFFDGGLIGSAVHPQPNIWIGDGGSGYAQGYSGGGPFGSATLSGLVITPSTGGAYGDIFYDPVSGDLITTGIEQAGIPPLPIVAPKVALVYDAGGTNHFVWNTALQFLGLSGKGDLVTWDNASLSPIILPVGTDTYVLTADSTAPNGIAWEPAAGGIAIGDPVGSGTPGDVLEVDGSGNLGQSTVLSLLGLAAKGDLLTWDGSASAPVILSVGTDTYVLTADSTAPNGIAWEPAAGGIAIGDPVGSGTPGDVLEVDGSGNLGQSTVLSLLGFAAKGDLLTWDGSASAPVILSVGTDTYVLTADSTQPDGIAWEVAPSSLVIGNPVSGGTNNELLYIDNSGNLGSAPGTTANVTGVMQFTSGALVATFGYNFSAGFFQDASNSVYLCDGTAAIDLISGNIALPGTSGNSLLWNNGHAAPASTQAVAAPALAYGQGTILEYLGTPDDWVLVNVRGTDYLMPLYLP